MGKFDGILFCTDLDGTLLNNARTISNENLQAIEYFKKEGGYFTFITGRMPYYAMHLCNAIKPNAPFGCVNGGGLYDGATGKYVWTKTLSKDVFKLVKVIDQKFDEIGILANCFERTHFCKENNETARFRKATGIPNLVSSYEQVKDNIAKITFASDDDALISAVEQTLRAHPLASKYDFIRSERTLFEILPKGIGKGVAVKKLCEHLGVDLNKTVVTGDYNNDISMFEVAFVGVAVANACPQALEKADYITVSNEQHAIAQVISDIENGLIKLG